MNRRAIALLLALSLSLVPAAGHAQVFIASSPHPDFKIGPLFVSAVVGKQDVGRHAGPEMVTMSWSLVLPPNKSAADIAQDLFILWPGEVTAAPGGGAGDPRLAAQVKALGFAVRETGTLRLSARARSEMGTAAAFKKLGEAPFVTFIKDAGVARGARGASYIRIPWSGELASLDWLVRLEVPLKGAIVPKPTSWVEETFWGRRHIITLGFGDVGSVSLYPLYFGVRDRVVPLARDFSMLTLNFSDADHLKIDETVPATVSRRMSETRPNTEMISLPLVASEGLAPQVLKVQFNYFPGRLPWRPILISALFLILGNLTGPLFAALARRIGRTLHGRVHIGRGSEQGRQTGTIPPREALEGIRIGETSYADVVRLCGPHAEEQQHLPSGQTRTMVYRGERFVPHRRRSFGWFATISHWDVEQHEVQIELEHDRVRDVQARVRRSRLVRPSTA
ncbi:MAG TPA: hypothetical protein VGT40_23565 [Methylomirabilota bacterium]|jgi:hypothetical protein|nr:hypothetical protein [Methylomirabilota bacterium]